MDQQKLGRILISGLAVVFAACNQPLDSNPNGVSQPPTSSAFNESQPIQIKPAQTTFVNDQALSLDVRLSSIIDMKATVQIDAPKELGLNTTEQVVVLQANKPQLLRLTGKLGGVGYFNVTASLKSTEYGVVGTDMVGFEVAARGSITAQAQNTSGEVSLEDHLKNLPEVNTAAEYIDHSLKWVKADAENRRDVPLEVKLNKIRFDKRDGGQTDEMTSIQRYLPGTGKGKPKKEDLLNEPPKTVKAKGLQSKGLGCFLGDWIDVRFTITSNGITLPLRNTSIGVFDENPWLQPSYVAAGNTDTGGWYHFQQPSCDWGTWWDYSKPDLYFVVSSEFSNWGSNQGVYNMFLSVGSVGLVYPYSIRSGTYWDNDTRTITINIAANGSAQSQAMWVHALSMQAFQYNLESGGAGAGYFPYRISWPSNDIVQWGGWYINQGATLAALLYPGSPNPVVYPTSHAYVSRIEIRGEDWINPFTILHEFGHEVMYFTSNPIAYGQAYGPLAFNLPIFAFGSHDGVSQQNYQLAYNEGWASYFANCVLHALGRQDLTYNASIYAMKPVVGEAVDTTYYNDRVYKAGGENESRVSTFLYAYTDRVLSTGIGFDTAYGRIRGSLWGIGRYNLDIHEADANSSDHVGKSKTSGLDLGATDLHGYLKDSLK
jgi:hypothetical protein